MAIYFWVGLGGMFGALLRYSVTALVGANEIGVFPVATLLANYLGCFLLPFFTKKLHGKIPGNLQKAVSSGLVGSFTTFSAFSAETVLLLQAGAHVMALLYVLLSIAGGLLFVYLGSKGKVIL